MERFKEFIDSRKEAVKQSRENPEREFRSVEYVPLEDHLAKKATRNKSDKQGDLKAEVDLSKPRVVKLPNLSREGLAAGVTGRLFQDFLAEQKKLGPGDKGPNPPTGPVGPAPKK